MGQRRTVAGREMRTRRAQPEPRPPSTVVVDMPTRGEHSEQPDGGHRGAAIRQTPSKARNFFALLRISSVIAGAVDTTRL